MNTGIIQIGNSDDKLSQKEWAEFISNIDQVLQNWQVGLHFHGYSLPDKPWQNACWVFEVDNDLMGLDDLKAELAYIARQFRQDSIAVTLGDTEFVKSDV